jgi:magnesium-transporting ATPase (P-type)
VLPVDGILVDGSEINMDESSVTGESDLIHKIPAFSESGLTKAFLISGSKVMDGSGKMIICAVGKDTHLGKLKEQL